MAQDPESDPIDGRGYALVREVFKAGRQVIDRGRRRGEHELTRRGTGGDVAHATNYRGRARRSRLGAIDPEGPNSLPLNCLQRR
jgi:hypothetical protein